MKITKEEFETYENCRNSGLTNMLNIDNVCQLTDLSREKVLFIIKNYDKLKK